MSRLDLSGFFASCGWGKFGVSCGESLGENGSVSGIEELGVLMVFMLLRTCVIGDGFYALHWNMLSWFRYCTNVFRGVLFR